MSELLKAGEPGVWAGPLVFDVLPGLTFTVEVLDVRPTGHDGGPCDGVSDLDRHRVLVWSGLRGVRRRHVVLHELWHAKRYYLGVSDASDAEADCDTAAAFMGSVLEQLERQGGLAALLGLVSDVVAEEVRSALVAEASGFEPLVVVSERRDAETGAVLRELTLEALEVDEPGESVLDRLGAGLTADCAGCERGFVHVDVWTGPARWVERLDGRLIGGQVVDRALYCPECGHVQRWVEGWDVVLGKPNGVPVCEPRFDRGASALEAHGERLRKQRRGGGEAA